jgi:acetyltransferase-like isoleucine patch superfamily enzyme
MVIVESPNPLSRFIHPVISRILIWTLKRVIAGQRRSVSDRWDRVLPVGEYLSDRWEKAKFMGFGTETSIYDSSIVIGSVVVGSKTWIGPFTVLDGSGGLSIGDNCSISAGVQIYTHHTVDWALSGGTRSAHYRPTTIGSRVYIGPNAVIQAGVSIGDGAVIGANSFVNKDVPAGSRAWGVPCRVDKS